MAAATAALACVANAAAAGEVTWNFGTSSGQLLNPSGTFSATPSGSTSVITPTNGQEAVFTSQGISVGAWGSCNGGTVSNPCNAKVTQENNYSTKDWANNTVFETGIGVCNTLCTGGANNAAIGDTEWLTIALNDPLLGGTSHASWDLESITFGNVLSVPGQEVEFWFSNSPNLATAKTNKIDDTILQTATNKCVGGIGAQGSCLFDFSAINDPLLNSYDYLYVTAVNPNGNDQPAIVVQSLTGDPPTPAPEPASIALIGAGLFGLRAAGRRRQKARL